MESKWSIIALLGILMLIAVPASALPDLNVTAINAYHYSTNTPPWFNLSNEVNVTVYNGGDQNAGEFNVSLYADSEFIGKQNVSGLDADSSTIVQFKWTPVGGGCFEDCGYTDTSEDYNLTAIADCDSDVAEESETNNDTTVVETACYNGYMADEPLETMFHGMLHGGLLFTTGDGTYGGLYSVGDYRNTTYQITLPAGASVELARLNVYYTWHYEKTSCPQMEVSIENTSGTYVVPLDVRYNDIKCWCTDAAWVFPWGNYVYDVTPYINGSGTYTVSVKRTGGPSFCIAAPGIGVLYQDDTRSLIEYWINEGADVLIGGRRSDGGHLSLEECINNATFSGEIDLSRVGNATLGVVSPWGGSSWDPGMTNYLYFNEIVLGQGVYHGYGEMYEGTIDGISMYVGSTNAQVGVNVSDVTDHLNTGENIAGQGDDGDNMMPSNAFLLVEYGPVASTPFLICGLTNDSVAQPIEEPDVVVTNLNTGEEWIAETHATFNFYQVLLTSDNVSDGDTLRITAKKMLPGGYTTPENYTYCVNITTVDVTQNEIDMGGLPELDLILNHFCINYYPDYPYFAQEAWNYSGAAVIKMWTEFKDEGPYTQDDLQAMGIANNTAGSDPYCIDPDGMAAVLNGLLPNHFTVGVHENTTEGLNHAMHRICWWQYLGPGSLPARGNSAGNYEFWMGIRGIHTDKNPHDGTYSAPYGYNVSGFWVNDPNTFGAGCIGENSYKTAVEWTETYYLPTYDPRIPNWNDKYITVLEPPEVEADIRIVPAKPRLARAITPVMMEKTLIVNGSEQIADIEVVDDDDALDVVKAAIDAVSEELIPYDLQFADIFAETVAGEPMLVSGGNGDYYIVPFEVLVKAVKPAPKKAVEIQKFAGDAATLLRRADGVLAIEPIPIDPISIDEKRTLVVVLVDAEGGSFKEASWVDEPMKYLPVSKVEALELVFKETKPPKAKPMIELVYRDGSTYYPDWKIMIGKMVFFVSQDGTVESEGPTLVPMEPEPMSIAK